MNFAWIDLTIAALIVGLIIAGLRRGALKSLFSLLRLILAVILAKFSVPLILNYLSQHSALYANAVSDTGQALYPAVETAQTGSQWAQALHLYNLPENGENFLNNLLISSHNAVGDKVQVFSENIVQIIFSIVIFVIAFLLIMVLLRGVEYLLCKVFELPILNFFNHVIGGAAGLLEGLFLCMVFVTVLYTIVLFSGNEHLATQINNSLLCRYFYFGSFFY